MPNCAIYEIGSNKISYFLTNCIKDDRSFIGENGKIIGLNLSVYNYVLTNDIAILSDDGMFDKSVNDLNPISNNISNLGKTNREEYIKSFDMVNIICQMNYDQIEEYIDENINDLDSCKNVLKVFGKAILGIVKQMNYKK